MNGLFRQSSRSFKLGKPKEWITTLRLIRPKRIPKKPGNFRFGFGTHRVLPLCIQLEGALGLKTHQDLWVYHET